MAKILMFPTVNPLHAGLGGHADYEMMDDGCQGSGDCTECGFCAFENLQALVGDCDDCGACLLTMAYPRLTVEDIALALALADEDDLPF
jgi:hypothetical protein